MYFPSRALTWFILTLLKWNIFLFFRLKSHRGGIDCSTRMEVGVPEIGCTPCASTLKSLPFWYLFNRMALSWGFLQPRESGHPPGGGRWWFKSLQWSRRLDLPYFRGACKPRSCWMKGWVLLLLLCFTMNSLWDFCLLLSKMPANAINFPFCQ